MNEVEAMLVKVEEAGRRRRLSRYVQGWKEMEDNGDEKEGDKREERSVNQKML